MIECPYSGHGAAEWPSAICDVVPMAVMQVMVWSYEAGGNGRMLGKKRKSRKKQMIALSLALLCIGGCGKGDAVVYDKNQCLADTDDMGQILFSKEESPDVQVNLAQPEGMPLLKKISQFTIGTGNHANIQNNARYLADLKAPSMRYPLSIWGRNYSENLIKGGVNYAYETVGDIFLGNGVPVMYWHLAEVECAYNFEYEGNGDVRYNPPVLSTYAQSWEIAAKYIREELGYRAYYEVLNECDHNGWYNGTWQEYVDTYIAAAKGIRKGDPYAEVGGLSSGSINRMGQERLDYFLNTVEREEAPLDFAAYHDYFQGYRLDTEILAEALDSRDYFSQTQMHLNEFNVYWPSEVYTTKTGADNFLRTAAAVPLIFDALEYFSEHPEITMVHWGTFSDDSEDLDLFTAEGEPTASYYALKTYQNMPVDRVHAQSDRKTIKVMASADGKEAGIVLWNSGEETEEINLLLEGIPSSGGMLEVYRIDSEHASVWECGSAEYMPLESYGNVTGEAVTWRGSIPAAGTVYIRWYASGVEEKAWPAWPEDLGQVVRKDYYYADRSKNTYAEIDENTGIVYLGMGDNEEGMGRCGVVLRNGAEKVKGKISVTGCQRETDQGAIGIRIDYGTGEALYTSSVYMVLGGTEPDDDTYPWGTGVKPDKVIREKGNTFTLPVAKYAPDNWNGEYVLSFEILDMGAGAAVKIEF